MADEQLNNKCSRFIDYILENYVTVNSKFPPTIWAAPPDPDTKRTLHIRNLYGTLQVVKLNSSLDKQQ
jgi:hypothetical protein